MFKKKVTWSGDWVRIAAMWAIWAVPGLWTNMICIRCLVRIKIYLKMLSWSRVLVNTTLWKLVGVGLLRLILVLKIYVRLLPTNIVGVGCDQRSYPVTITLLIIIVNNCLLIKILWNRMVLLWWLLLCFIKEGIQLSCYGFLKIWNNKILISNFWIINKNVF